MACICPGQEARMSRAVELMVAHVESLRRRHDKNVAELEEMKKMMQQHPSSYRNSINPTTSPGIVCLFNYLHRSAAPFWLWPSCCRARGKRQDEKLQRSMPLSQFHGIWFPPYFIILFYFSIRAFYVGGSAHQSCPARVRWSFLPSVFFPHGSILQLERTSSFQEKKKKDPRKRGFSGKKLTPSCSSPSLILESTRVTKEDRYCAENSPTAVLKCFICMLKRNFITCQAT